MLRCSVIHINNHTTKTSTGNNLNHCSRFEIHKICFLTSLNCKPAIVFKILNENTNRRNKTAQTTSNRWIRYRCGAQSDHNCNETKLAKLMQTVNLCVVFHHIQQVNNKSNRFVYLSQAAAVSVRSQQTARTRENHMKLGGHNFVLKVNECFGIGKRYFCRIYIKWTVASSWHWHSSYI